MKKSFQLSPYGRRLTGLLLIFAFISSQAFGWQGSATAEKPLARLSETERETSGRLKVETIKEITTALAADDMQGRGTGLPGGDKATKYIAERYMSLGLKPLGDNKGFLQSINFKSTEVMSDATIKVGDQSLKFGDEFVVLPPSLTDSVDLNVGLVFGGYGVVSPDLKRDDLAGLDFKGKLVLLIGGHPKNIDDAAWKKSINPQTIMSAIFGGGAAGVIVGNLPKEQSYSMIAEYFKRRQVALADDQERPFKIPPIIFLSDKGAEKLFIGSGITYAQAIEKAETGENISRDLNKTATVSLHLKKTDCTGSNVVGFLEGSDAKLKDQAVVYTAHYDAFGTDANGNIYHGAADNALGVGMMLSIAEVFTKLSIRPRRSIIFLAVTGEEHGLLGSQYWAAHPTWPIDKIAADLNFDGIGTEVYGPVKQVVGYGAEYSDLGESMNAVVTAVGDSVLPDPFPEEHVFYRSDHYAFVKKGVPSLMMTGAPEGDPSAIIARAKRWLDTDYHQPTDTVRSDWNWDGPRSLAQIGFVLGARIGNADAMPAWLPSSPFNHPRASEASKQQ